MKRVGIYAGTFDPIHEGHLAFAHTAIAACKLDKIFFLVEPVPRRKQGVRAFMHRQAMVEAAIDQDPILGSILLEDQERFSVHETLPILMQRFKGGELFLLLGEDVVTHLAEWPHVGELLQNVQCIIGLRTRSEGSMGREMEQLKRDKGISFNYNILSTSMSSITSSKIRLDLKHDREAEGLPLMVANYIKTNGLYSAQDERAKP